MNNLIRNIFITIMLVTAIVGYDIAHTPTTEAKDTTIPSPTPFIGTSNIKHGEVTITELPKRNFITVKVSHYWPDLGGVNCLTFKNGHCVSKMANGVEWEKGIDKSIACPKELKLGTQIKILGRVWTCHDRGSMIVKADGKYWVDMLTEKAIVPYGEEIKAEILK
jgi:hypothetical protein